VGGVRRGYSSPLYWASQKPWVSGMTQIGMRGTGSARRAELEAARDYHSHIFTATTVHAEGLDAALESVPSGSAVYVTIDADGIDPTEMPASHGTGARRPAVRPDRPIPAHARAQTSDRGARYSRSGAILRRLESHQLYNGRPFDRECAWSLLGAERSFRASAARGASMRSQSKPA
jgi:hypothetical protein